MTLSSRTIVLLYVANPACAPLSASRGQYNPKVFSNRRTVEVEILESIERLQEQTLTFRAWFIIWTSDKYTEEYMYIE